MRLYVPRRGTSVGKEVMTRIRNGFVVVLAICAILAGLSMMSSPGDKPLYDFRKGGPLYPKHTIPSLSPGRKYVTLTVVWKGRKPDYILYRVASTNNHVAQSELAGGKAGSWNHNVPYVPGTFYAVTATTTEAGSLDCLIAVDGKTYASNHRDDAGPLRCYINQP